MLTISWNASSNFFWSSSWHKQSKHGDVQAYKIDEPAVKQLSPSYIDGREFWAGRHSTHKGDASLYEKFAMGLLTNHSLNEKDYIESCQEAERLEVIEEGVMEGEWLACQSVAWGACSTCAKNCDRNPRSPPSTSGG